MTMHLMNRTVGVRRLGAVLLAAVAISVGVAALPSPSPGDGLLASVGPQTAAASAYTCAGYGYGKGNVHPQFCAQTQGDGLYIKSFGAGFSSPVGWAGILCNTRVRAEFVDNRGAVYASYLSRQQNGCSTVGAWKWTFGTASRARQGTLKYTLLSNGASIVVVQHRLN